MSCIRPWGRLMIWNNDFQPLYWLIILLCTTELDDTIPWQGLEVTVGEDKDSSEVVAEAHVGPLQATSDATGEDQILLGPSATSTPQASARTPVVSNNTKHECGVCKKAFSRKDNLRRHVTLHDGKSCRCHICGKVYQTSSQLRRHIDAAHHDIRHQCATCEKCFAYKHDLVAHMQGHTGDSHSYKCTVCGKAMSKQSFLNDHMNKHFAKKPHVCRKCGQSFASNSTLNHHKKICGLVKSSAKCKSCDKVFKSIKYLREHEKTIHGPSNEYQCDTCGKTYAQRAGLFKHKKSCWLVA